VKFRGDSGLQDGDSAKTDLTGDFMILETTLSLPSPQLIQ